MMRGDQGRFYGWWIAAACFMTLFVTVGTGLYAPPVFLLPLQEHFGWSRAAIATGSGIAALTSGLASPLVGSWIDRYGPRRIIILGGLVMGGGFASFGLMSSLWQLYAVNVIAACGMTCAAWIPNQTLISNWFDKKRGLAMGVSLTGIGFGGLAMAPLTGLLIVRLGWRLAFVGLGLLICAIVIPVAWMLVRSKPSDLGLLPDGAARDLSAGVPYSGSSSGQHLTAGIELGESLRTSAFWLLALCNFLTVFASLSVVGHLVAFLGDRGFGDQTAATVLGITVGVSVSGRFLFGLVSDRINKRHAMAVALVGHAVAVLFLMKIDLSGALAAFVLTYGLALGGGAVVMPLLVGECFGLLSFGKILGLIMLSATLGAAAGPILTGRIYDVTGSYDVAFILHVAAFLTAALTVSFVTRPDLSWRASRAA